MRLQKLIYQGIVWRGLYYASVFVLNIVIARVYKAADSGLINYLINNLSFLLLITGLSLESALGYFGSRNEINAEKLTGLSISIALLSALTSTAVLWMFAARHPENIDQPYLLLAFVYGFGVALANYTGSLFYSRQKVLLPNTVFIGVNILVIGFAIYQFNVQDEPANNLFLVIYFSSFLAQGLILLVCWMVQEHGLGRMSLPSTQEMTVIFRYTFIALVANLIFFLVYRVDYWFVKSFCDDAQLGNYIQVSKLGQIFLLLPSIVATAVFTRTAGGRQEQIRNVIEIISRWLLLLYLLFVLLIALTGVWLFPWVYGQSFDQMYGPFLLLSPGILSLSTLSLLTAFYAGKNKVSINIKGSAIALVVIVTGNFMFIPQYGIYAAAAVSSIGYICFQVYVLTQFKREYQSNLLAFFIPRISDWQKVKQFVRQHEAD